MNPHALLAFAFVAAMGSQSPPSVVQPPATAPQAATPPLDLRAILPGGVVAHGDVTYSVQRGVRPLTMDIYAPPGRGPHPAVVFLHGGSWYTGSRRDAVLAGAGGDGDGFGRVSDVMARVAAKGYVAVSISYRLSSEAKFPAPIHDLDAALAYLKAQSAVYGVDPARIVTWGASAGAQVVITQALDCRTHALDPDAVGKPTCPAGVIDWYGPADLPLPDNPVVTAYLGCDHAACPETYRQASGVNLAVKDAPPFLILHGDNDHTVPVAQSRALAAALQAKGDRVRLHVVSNGEHGFRGASAKDIEAGMRDVFTFLAEVTR